MSDSENAAHDEIAVIGMAGRFPGAANVEEFWENLKNGVESITFFSDEELRAEGLSTVLLDNPDYVKAGAIIHDVELFDASFFGFTPREAEITDPQHRLFMECSWEALENAGYDPESYQGLIGTYAGQSSNGYFYNNVSSHPEIVESLGSLQILIGNDKDHLATQVSYKLNLKGPAFTVQTSCSTSLVAVHLACESLLNYRSDMALAGGVSVKVPSKKGYLYQKGSINSPDGHCRAFDAGAQGVMGGNGVGVVVLKRLEDALADGDTIHAVIKGSAINNDGSAKVGYTAPGLDGQAEVIAMAQATAEVEAESITYVEAHGTGTSLGDPIEIAALTQAWHSSTDRKGICAVGSVKTNIGHLDAAAGVAGLIKTVLSLRHGMIPPSLNFQKPNPEIDFANSPFYVNTHLREWEVRDGSSRRAGVSSFGIGGTNAHVILEQAPSSDTHGDPRPLQLLTLSAKSEAALEKMADNLAQHLKENPSLNLHDVAYTLQAGRRAFKYRLSVVCRDVADASSVLLRRDPLRISKGVVENQARPVVFMFAGQGSQRVGMARELYEVEPLFREQVDLCAERLAPHLGLDLREIIYPSEANAEAAAQQINQTSLTQPALFVIEYALAKLWMSWGVQPQAMLGHSIGEYVAACLAGVFTLEEALRLVARRGQMIQGLPVGSMLAVALAEDELKPLLDAHLSIAAINGARDCVVSGQTGLVDELEISLRERGIASRRLHTSHAFHSGMMSPILEEFRVEVQKIDLQPPRIPYLSNVTGTWIMAGEATDPAYWMRHLRQPVRFFDAVKELAQKPEWVLLELGPAQTLTSIFKRHSGGASQQVVLSSLPQSGRSIPEYEHLLRVSGELWLSGVALDRASSYDVWRRHRVPLPSYPFERQRYWLDPATDAKAGDSSTSKERKSDIADWFYVPSWSRAVAPKPLSASELGEQKSVWLVLADANGFGTRLRARLEEAGQEVVSVVEGASFEQTGERAYTLDPDERSHYVELAKEVRARESSPLQIFHLWNLTGPGATAEAALASPGQVEGFHRLLFLAQAFGSQNASDTVNILFVANNLQEVTGEETLNPLKATALGACRVMAHEYPNLDTRSVDIVLPATGTPSEIRLVDALIAEAQSKPKGRTVAYRGLHRWTQTFAPVRLDQPPQEHGRLKEGGVYLITNGLAELGLALAEYLFREWRARLILTTPSDAFPIRERWADWLTSHDEQDETRRQIERLIELEKSGAEMVVCTASAGSLPEFRRAIEMGVEKLGRINGLIHAEDVLGTGLIQLKTSATTEQVFSSKVEGTLALEALFGDASLDFIVLFSSVIASVGGVGLVEYCAASAFLDAFAHYKTLNGPTPAIAIDWDIAQWDTGQESLAPDIPEVRAQLRTLRETFGIRLPEAVEAFARVMGTNHSQVVVSTQDFASIFAQQDASKAVGLMEQLGKLRAADAASQRMEAGVDYEAPRNDIEQQMAEIWQKLSGIERIGINENFFDIGGNSLLAIQLLSQIRETFDFDIPVNSLFESPTIAALSNVLIENQLQEQLGDLDKLLEMIEDLSEEEASERLNRELQAGDQEVSHE